MFRVTATDNRDNAIYIQGSVSKDPTQDIAGIVLQNYDNDTQTTYNMAAISMHDHYGTSNQNGCGDLVFRNNPDGSGLVETVRVNCYGQVGINTSNPQYSLDVNGDVACIDALIESNLNVIGTSFINNLTVNSNFNILGIFALNNSLVNSNLTVLGTGTFSNNVTINSNLVVLGTTTNTGLSTLNTTQVNSNLNVVGTSTFNAIQVNSNLGVVGISTFSNNATINSNLNVIGISTFSNNVNINSNLSILGTLGITLEYHLMT